MSSGEEENVEGIESSPIDESDPVFRSVAEADVSLDEMMSLACRQGKLDIVELLLESGAHVDYRNKAGNTPLLEACSQGHVDVARYLLDHHANIDAPTETTSDSALTWACTLGNEAIVSLLLERKANVEHRTKDGCTALMFAALAGHVKVAAMLLDHKAEINVESDSNKDSPLTFACWKGHCDVVELLLLRNANIEHRTKEGFTPLMFAALGGHTDVAAKLLEQGAKVNVPSGSNNDIPLTSACWKGHHDVVKLLLEYNSNIEHRTKDGCTPLMLAAREGHYSVAKLILDSRAEVNKPSGSENNIPLTLSCWKGHTKVVELLLDHKSNIEHRNKAGCTPLMLAAREGHVETTQLLLSRGAEINKPSGSNDDTPLTLACWKGHVGVVELLLKHNSKVDHQTKTGCTPLMEATREGHVAVAKLLLEHNADVELPDNYGQSPLFMACWKGHSDVAELLLEHNANRDCRTKTGITPLFQACRENHVDVVKLLLDYGASVNATFPNSRENPLTIACEKGHAELVSLLLRRNAILECHTKKGCTPFHLSSKEGHLAIAIALHVRGADTEAPDYRNNTPLVSTMKNGHVEALEWLLNVVDHLPSEEQCQKCLVAPIEDKERHDELMLGRTKCYDLILKCKKAKEQKVQRNTELLLKELENEKERENNRKKKAAAKRRDKRRRRKAAKESEQAKELKEEAPLENRPQEVAEPPDSEEESSDIEEEKEQTQMPKENHKLENLHNDERVVKVVMECNRKKESQPDCPRDRGKLIMNEETSSLVGSNDRQHQQNQDSPNDFEERKSSGGDKPKNKKKPVDVNSIPKESQSSLKETSSPSKNRNCSSQDVESTLKENSNSRDSSSVKDDKKKTLSSNKGNKVKEEKESDSKTRNNNTVNGVRNDTKQEKPKRDNSQRHNSAGISASTNKTTTGTPNITTSSVNVSERERTGEVSSGHPVSPRDRSKLHPSPKSSPESDKENDKSAKQRSKDAGDGVEGGSTGDYNKHKTVSRGSTTTGQSSTSVKTSPSDNDKEQKTLQSPRSKVHPLLQVLKEESWKEVTRPTNSKTMVVQLTAPNALCGRVIGRGGSKINSITEESGAQITIGKPEPKAPTDRVITIKGSTKSVQRAKFLVTQALNTPSTSGQTTNGTPSYTTTTPTLSTNASSIHTNTPLTGNFPALNSSSSDWPTITQANTMATTAVVKVSKDPSPETVVETTQETPVSQTHSRTMSSGSSDSGYSAGHNNKSTTNTPQVSKTATVAWSNQMAWKPNRPSVTQSIGVSTSAVTTCVSSSHTNGLSESSHTMTTSTRTVNANHTNELRTSTSADIKDVVTTVAAITCAETTSAQRDVVEPGRPIDTVASTTGYVSMWSNSRRADENGDIKGHFGAIGDIPTSNSVFQETSPSFPSRRKEPLISEPPNTIPRQSPPSARATKFYSPWSTQPTGITDIRRDNAFSSNSDKYEGALPGMELFAGSNSLFSGSIQSYPWSSGEDADQLDRSRSVSWSGQADYDSSVPTSNQKCDTTHHLTPDLHTDQRPMGNSWSWGQNKTTLPSALSVVCDDNPPDKQAWNNSDSTSSSQSSSRQELNSIMDNEGPSVVWSSSNFDDNNLTPTPNSSSLSHPDPSNHGTTQWNSARGAFSAPSSPSMPRSQSQPDSSSKSPARPSVDDSGVRSWNKHKSPRSQSSSDTPSGWNHNTQEARRSSVDMSFPGEISKSPWQYSSRQQELYQSNYSREPWADSHVSPSSVDVANVLKRLTLEKYLSVFQEHKITGSRLEQMSESDLEDLGIPKGPRLKLLHAIHGTRSTTWPTMNNSFPSTGNGYIKSQHPPTNVSISKIKPTPNIMENHNHMHAHTEPGMTPLAIKKALQKQEGDNQQQQPIPNHGNHSNQPLLSLMSHGRAVNQTAAHGHPNHNHTEYGGGLPPRPHSASGNLSSPQVFTANSTPHVDQFSYGAQQGPYVNHMTTYTQQIYYPGGYYYYYPQQ